METTDYCPKCNSELVARKGKHGDFFGCSNFPKCKYTTKARWYKKTTARDFRDKQVYPGHFEGGKK